MAAKEEEAPASDSDHIVNFGDVETRVARFSEIVVKYPRMTRCIGQLRRLHFARRHGRRKAAGMLVYGITGSGKSRIAQEYEQLYPRFEEEDRTVVPVLRVVSPGQPTAKAIAERVLISLGDPMADRGSAEERWKRVRHLLKACRVELIIFDEIQQMTDNLNTRERSIAADALKNLMDESGVPCVFVGTPTCASYFMGNQQLSRRCNPKMVLRPFRYKTEDQRKEFARLLLALQQHFPLSNKRVFVDEDVVKRTYYATFGLVGFLAELLESALRTALNTRLPGLTTALLESAFKEVIFPECPDARNPFHATFEWIPLKKVGEPFYGLDDGSES